MPDATPARTPPATAVARRPVVAMDRRERQRRERLAELKRAPRYLVAALVAHAAFFVWWALRPATPVTEPPPRHLQSEMIEEAPPPPPPTEEVPPPEVPKHLPPPDEDVQVDATMDDDPSLSEWDPRPSSDALGLGGAGGGGGGRRPGRGSEPVELVSAGPGASGFRLFVDDLRGRGLDVAFVVDCTASMEKFIVQARATIDDIIADLSAVVPDLRVGLVGYRDRQDLWLTRLSDLTDNRYVIHNFLLDLQADGGGDFEEAVEEGLRVAVKDLTWRPEARRVLLLVGDAPAHSSDEPAVMSLVRGFAREGDAALSALYTGGSGTVGLAERDRNAREFFTAVVRAGGGQLFELGEARSDLQAQMLDASFGAEWRDEIRALLSTRTADTKTRIVRQKVRSGDRAWLLEHLDEDPPHPAVVDGCVELFDAGVARRALELLADETRPRTLRAAALYVLRKKAAPDVSLDVARPLAEQLDQLARLRREVDRLGAAAGSRTPPPPPPPQPR
jgi:HAMP domain-containing protein